MGPGLWLDQFASFPVLLSHFLVILPDASQVNHLHPDSIQRSAPVGSITATAHPGELI